MDPQNNTLYVAGGSPGGMAVSQRNSDTMSQPVNLYMDGVLLYEFKSRYGKYNSANSVLILDKNLRHFVDKNILYLNTFLLTSEHIIPRDPSTLLTLTDLRKLLDKAYAEYRAALIPTLNRGRPEATTPAV